MALQLQVQKGHALDPNTRRPAILIIDDDRDLTGLLAAALGQSAHVTVANNWADGRVRLAEKRFALVLLDVFLPDAALLEPLETIRDIDLDYPVVMMSGNVDRNDPIVERAMRLGVNSVLGKPFDMPALQRHLTDCLGPDVIVL